MGYEIKGSYQTYEVKQGPSGHKKWNGKNITS